MNEYRTRARLGVEQCEPSTLDRIEHRAAGLDRRRRRRGGHIEHWHLRFEQFRADQLAVALPMRAQVLHPSFLREQDGHGTGRRDGRPAPHGHDGIGLQTAHFSHRVLDRGQGRVDAHAAVHTHTTRAQRLGHTCQRRIWPTQCRAAQHYDPPAGDAIDLAGEEPEAVGALLDA